MIRTEFKTYMKEVKEDIGKEITDYYLDKMNELEGRIKNDD